jgi:hypothetical protein
MKIVKVFLLVLISAVLLNSCALFDTTPDIYFVIPASPELPSAAWRYSETGEFCTNEEGASNLLKADTMQEGYIETLKLTIDECNKALNK